jgi:hypothetical protein
MSTLVKPSWLSSSVEHKLICLLDLCASVLKDVCHKLSLSASHKEHNKHGWSSCIVNAFESCCIELIGKITSELKHLLSSLDFFLMTITLIFISCLPYVSSMNSLISFFSTQ